VLKPSAGEVVLDGNLASALTSRERARRIAFVPQSEPTLFEFTVREIVLMGRHPHVSGLSGETTDDFAAAARAMAVTDTLELADRPVTQLSGGEHRRTLIARAMAQNAPSMLLDEPTAHLDLTHQADILNLVRKAAMVDGFASLAALHDLNLAAEFCDRLILMKDGRIASEGRPDEVLTEAALRDAYGPGVKVSASPATGRPIVLAMPAPYAVEGAESLRVHVICGGGSGTAIMASLRRRGFVVTAGVINRLDSDETACTALGIDHVSEAPFSRISPEVRAACAEMMRTADAVLIADTPFGPGNLANLELAAEAQSAGKPIYLLAPTPIEKRDFANGQATRLWSDLISSGASPITELDELKLPKVSIVSQP
jgi:iron complex transport system ATP-binding protein